MVLVLELCLGLKVISLPELRLYGVKEKFQIQNMLLLEFPKAQFLDPSYSYYTFHLSSDSSLMYADDTCPLVKTLLKLKVSCRV